MALNIDGISLTPIQSGFNPDYSIIRPEYGGAGLLDDGNSPEYRDLINNFAGGILNGYQVIDNQVVPINPSGIYTGSGMGNDPNMSMEDEGGDGAFTIMDLMDFQTAMGQANFGNQDPVSAFQMFEDKGKGTFDIRAGSPYSNLLFGVNEMGERVPLNMAVDKRGNQLSPQLVRNRIKSSFSLIDESGGDGGGDGGD
tara:strand:- start:1455 stop:2045 length:591 start_codon:yes stop_codon:yes gene_type:complete